MPNGKSSGKHSRQLLFSEAIVQPKTMVAQAAPFCPTTSPADPHTIEAMDRILQEITAVGRRLEEMDLKISDLTIASTSIRADIAGFQETVSDLDWHLTTVEDQVTTLPNQDAELRSLRAKIWRTGVAEIMFAFLASQNTKRPPISKLFSKTSYPSSLAWISHHHWSSKESTGLALYIKRPLAGPVPLSHVCYITIRLARLSGLRDPKVRTPWRDTRSGWQRIFPG
ncbi:hypothetical protein NDU88_002787 [Pleurodeles waltl]|uniref:Uncharacterized protein n=1 Tax=Pleurodeles waltl TaxID=8319 RepID=A0AAV7SF27_PLEWA|nr:hypothetical protein NDU88_002787 [Pleurodeles waltl]